MRKFILILFLLGIVACHFPNRYRLARTNKKVNFQAYFKSDTLLMPDTNAVYILIDTNISTGKPEYVFKRYFGNGRVYRSRIFYDLPPSEKDFNELSDDPERRRSWNKGQKFYYDITKDGLLIHEYFVSGYDGYHYIYSKVYHDSIINILRKPRGLFRKPTPMHGVYIKKKVKLTNFNVDW